MCSLDKEFKELIDQIYMDDLIARKQVPGVDIPYYNEEDLVKPIIKW